jgi:primosomal protein N' (replication factor Y)
MLFPHTAAGRAEKSGNVVIQTYTPEHFSIVSAANQDYNAFYEQEIAYRKLCGYPPADNLMKIMLSSPDEMLLTKSAAWVKAFVDNNCKYKGLMCIGPADAPIYKIKDVYSKIIYVKHKDREVLNSIHEKLDVNIVGNQAFKNINVQYDING